MSDLTGANFYLTEADALNGTSRAEGCLSDLKSLNPYCQVATYSGELTEEYIKTQCFSAIVVTQLLPKAKQPANRK